MRLIKYGHACVRLEKDSRALVIDPGMIMPDAAALAGAEAVLVTHEHWDHLDAGRLRAAAESDPELVVYTCEGVARGLAEFGDRVRVVRDGDVVKAAGFEVAVVGERHHVSHPDVAPVGNVGFLVDGEVFHPGDALTVVDAPTLLVPGQAPWMTVPDLIGYLRAVRPRRAFAVHDGLLNEWGLKVLDGVLESERERLGADIRRLPVGAAAEL
ncbi:MBL fold metallo-hydrolase [Nonomuraea sp. SBT364]|uniref:MBL fold metallo-hydrolase n=1 Tax=Nonomuraea sp. SBT364 TaxID=1580530 RepID=UPI00066B33C9|nr:MBL fold metallo-hydrolase [Nonomuraea sp. SBT364]